MKWSKDILDVNKNLQPVTNNGNIFVLERKEKDERLGNGKRVRRGYAIYKLINVANGDPQSTSEAYIMIMENDIAPSLYNPPILLNMDQVLEFLNCPEKAAEYAFNEWLNCYR